jgi:hypothetical protein
MSCTNNLKQIGLGVHNFHDSQRGIPPYSVAVRLSLSFWGVIFPYIEQQALYEHFSSLSRSNEDGDVTHTGFAVPINNDWWGTLSPEFQSSLGSIAGYKCPSRRSGTALFNEFASTTLALPAAMQGFYLKGPLGDYAVVVSDHTWDPAPAGVTRTGTGSVYGTRILSNILGSPTDLLSETTPEHANLNYILSPIRTAVFTRSGDGTTEPRTLEWTPRDDFGFVADGLSNQFLIGEKYIPASRVGVCTYNQVYDGTYLSSSVPLENTFARNLFRLTEAATPTYIARGMNEAENVNPTSPSLYPQFGAFHTGTVNFLVGDGSVHGVSVATNRELLEAFANASDGVAVALP